MNFGHLPYKHLTPNSFQNNTPIFDYPKSPKLLKKTSTISQVSFGQSQNQPTKFFHFWFQATTKTRKTQTKLKNFKFYLTKIIAYNNLPTIIFKKNEGKVQENLTLGKFPKLMKMIFSLPFSQFLKKKRTPSTSLNSLSLPLGNV
jgi:hypothetical protein